MTQDKKLDRKRKRFAARLKSSKNIACSEVTGPNIIICNAGQATGLEKSQIHDSIISAGLKIELPKYVAEKGETYSFLVFKTSGEAELFYNYFNGKDLDELQLCLYFVENVPSNETICRDENPKGLLISQDFITPEEEELFLKTFHWPEDSDGSALKNRLVRHYGYDFRYGSNDVDLSSPLSDKIPDECDILWARLKRQGLDLTVPDQLTVNKYYPGQGIPSHIDKHSPFGETILSLSLGSAIVMDWKHHSGRYVPIYIAARSMLIMQHEARYDWQHGIQPRTHDPVIIETLGTDGKPVKVITDDTVPRGTRISLTFRWTRSGPCTCVYKTLCDSVERAEIEDEVAAKLEELHVHQVYERISGHFSRTRHARWPGVARAGRAAGPGAVLLDLGAGNGKNLQPRPDVLQILGERSSGLALEGSASVRGAALAGDCVRLDVLAAPLRDACADLVLCIAVIHHFSTQSRRLQALSTIVRVLRPGGRALVTAWARDQTSSNYLLTSKKPSNAPPVQVCGLHLPVHENRTQFQHADLLVPWKLRSEQSNETQDTLLRYYHVFEEKELEELCRKFPVEIEESYYEEGNWCVLFRKL